VSREAEGMRKAMNKNIFNLTLSAALIALCYPAQAQIWRQEIGCRQFTLRGIA
jgi:hypothetical protein